MKQHINDYFEGILQVRNGTPELLTWIHNRVKADNKAKFTKEKRVSNGIDLYITDQHYLQNLGRKIKEKFTGILKTSKRLHTMDKMTSKHLYRVSVLFKLLPVKRGDVITLQGEQAEVLRINHRAQIKIIKSGLKKEIDLDTLLRAIR